MIYFWSMLLLRNIKDNVVKYYGEAFPDYGEAFPDYGQTFPNYGQNY
jgi:hypothetical protein